MTVTIFGAPQTTRRRLCNDQRQSRNKKGKYCIVSYRASTPMPSLFSLVLVLLLLLMFYLSSRVFTGVTTDVTNACAEATRDGGTTGTSSVLFCSSSHLFFFSLFFLIISFTGVTVWTPGPRNKFLAPRRSPVMILLLLESLQ